MGALGQLRQAFEVAGRAIGFASSTQGGARRELVDSLEQVASKCDDAYTQVRTALRPVRESYRDPVQLAAALRAFAADANVRTSIKPHQLCGEVTTLLDKLADNLDPLKYAIDVRKIKAVRASLGELHQLDYDIKNEYEEFTRDLDAVADQLDHAAGDEAQERIAYVRQVIADFDRELSDLVTSVSGRPRTALWPLEVAPPTAFSPPGARHAAAPQCATADRRPLDDRPCPRSAGSIEETGRT